MFWLLGCRVVYGQNRTVTLSRCHAFVSGAEADASVDAEDAVGEVGDSVAASGVAEVVVPDVAEVVVPASADASPFSSAFSITACTIF